MNGDGVCTGYQTLAQVVLILYKLSIEFVPAVRKTLRFVHYACLIEVI